MQDRFAGSTGAPSISRGVCRSFCLVAAGLISFLMFPGNLAHAVQPPYSSGLIGTWVNTQSSGLIAQVVIGGGISIVQAHVYGYCPPTTCDWGSFTPSRFSDGVTSDSAIGFRLTISSSTDTKIIQGHLLGFGILEISTQISYPPGGSNNNYQVTEEFRLQGLTGGPVVKVPSNPPPLTGTWTAVNSSGGISQFIVTESDGAFQIHPYGACSPTDCDWGVQPVSLFSDSPTSSTPMGFQASFNLAAARFLQGHLILNSTGETLLEVTNQSSFAAPDPRYDYELTEDFQLSGSGTPSFAINPASSSLTIASGAAGTE